MSAPTATPPRPLWLHHAEIEHDCEHCGAVIPPGDPIAWLPDGEDGELLCLDCGCTAEDHADAREAAA